MFVVCMYVCGERRKRLNRSEEKKKRFLIHEIHTQNYAFQSKCISQTTVQYSLITNWLFLARFVLLKVIKNTYLNNIINWQVTPTKMAIKKCCFFLLLSMLLLLLLAVRSQWQIVSTILLNIHRTHTHTHCETNRIYKWPTMRHVEL